MSMLDALNPTRADNLASERAALVKSLDMATLWQSCAALVCKALPVHSCSLMFDIDGLHPQQGRHYLAEAGDDAILPVTSLDVAAPYLDANPQVPWYTFSQIASQDAQAAQRLHAQNPAPGWREFIHLAFWDGPRLEAVLSLRLRADHGELSPGESSFLMELYPLLGASLQRVQMIESERTRHRTFEGLLHDLPLAAVLIDPDLSPSYPSREAKRIFRRWSEDSDTSSRLPRIIETPLREWLEKQPRDASTASPRMQAAASFSITHPQRPSLRLRLEISPAVQTSFGHAHYLLILTPEGENETDLDASSPRLLPLLKNLSPSERKVAMLVAAGLRNDAIAERLCRSRKTVETQISSIFRKLNVANRTQLARMLS
ncbi:MAG: helix-turn-helix transcriptional regulator [Pseudoxanthomonas sp.]